MNILEIIRLTIVILSMLGLVLGFRLPKRSAFDTIITLGLVVLLIHAAQALIFDRFFPERPYLDAAAPYGILYGPFLYLAITSENKTRLDWSRLLVHGAAFIILFLLYLLMVSFQDLRELLLPTFYKIFYALLPLSFLGYAIVGSLRMKGEGINLNRRVLYFSIIVLAVQASFFLTLRFTKPEAPDYSFPVLMIYLIMLTATMILVYYRLLIFKEESFKSSRQASLTGHPPNLLIGIPHYRRRPCLNWNRRSFRFWNRKNLIWMASTA